MSVSPKKIVRSEDQELILLGKYLLRKMALEEAGLDSKDVVKSIGKIKARVDKKVVGK